MKKASATQWLHLQPYFTASPPAPNSYKICKLGHKVKQQHGISRHDQNYSSYRLFSYKKESYQQWKHCPGSAGLYKGCNHHAWRYRHSNTLNSYLLQTLRNKPCMSDNYTDFFHYPLLTATATQCFWIKLPIYTVPRKVQRGFDITSHKSQANSTTGNTMYWEKGIGSGLSINTAVIYPDLKIKDFTFRNTQNCSNASLLFLLSGCTAVQRSSPHF